MYDIPTEDSLAGSVLAVVVVAGPLTSIILSWLIKPKATAFFTACGAGGLVVTIGAVYAVMGRPGEGTEVGAAIFGGFGLLLTLLASGITVGGRALTAASKAEARKAAAS